MGLCRDFGHVAWCCPRSAVANLSEPYPGWTANGEKIPDLWEGPNITKACAEQWLHFLKQHPELNLSVDASGVRALPDFKHVAKTR